MLFLIEIKHFYQKVVLERMTFPASVWNIIRTNGALNGNLKVREDPVGKDFSSPTGFFGLADKVGFCTVGIGK